mgnify:CR=1 FL=1
MPGHVDAHHHVWSLARGDYGWLTPALAPIHRDYTLADLRPLREQAGVTDTVLVQAAPTVAETRYLLGVAERSDGVVKGVVGWVDLGDPSAIPTLTHLARNPPNSRNQARRTENCSQHRQRRRRPRRRGNT